jgi:hypothetical protein
VAASTSKESAVAGSFFIYKNPLCMYLTNAIQKAYSYTWVMYRSLLFAGTPSSTKTQIATYLSWQFGVGIFSTNVIRREIHVKDMSTELDIPALDALRDERLKVLTQSRRDFIYDASVDRRWGELKQHLEDAGYEWKLISLDLSKELITRLDTIGDRHMADPKRLGMYFQQHQDFLAQFGADVSLSITDENFSDRLARAYDLCKGWLDA